MADWVCETAGSGDSLACDPLSAGFRALVPSPHPHQDAGAGRALGRGGRVCASCTSATCRVTLRRHTVCPACGRTVIRRGEHKIEKLWVERGLCADLWGRPGGRARMGLGPGAASQPQSGVRPLGSSRPQSGLEAACPGEIPAMARAAEEQTDQPMGGRRPLSLTIPCKAEYVALCRLVVGALGTHEALDEELIADFKVVVTEACNCFLGDPDGCVPPRRGGRRGRVFRRGGAAGLLARRPLHLARSLGDRRL